MNSRTTLRLLRPLAAAAALLLLALTASCSRQMVDFRYPAEKLVFPELGERLPRLHIGSILDLRPEEQHRGSGHLVGLTYPADKNWMAPVDAMYRDALSRDIAQTALAELTPVADGADFVLEAEIYSFHGRLERNAGSFLLPLGLGMTAGLVWGEDSSDKLKRGAALGVVGLLALPMPASNRAECEVRLILRDPAGEEVWRQTCIGEVDTRVYEEATARPDKGLAEKYLPQAVKRCNACLLGQLRQFLNPPAGQG